MCDCYHLSPLLVLDHNRNLSPLSPQRVSLLLTYSWTSPHFKELFWMSEWLYQSWVVATCSPRSPGVIPSCHTLDVWHAVKTSCSTYFATLLVPLKVYVRLSLEYIMYNICTQMVIYTVCPLPGELVMCRCAIAKKDKVIFPLPQFHDDEYVSLQGFESVYFLLAAKCCASAVK